MRPEFRAWNISGKRWEYFTLEQLACGGVYNFPKDMPAICNWDNYQWWGQNTGLKDKDGKSLDWWQGDKFRIDGHLYAIVFDKGCFWFDGIDMPYRYSAHSVSIRPNGNVPSKIGNIYMNQSSVE